MAASPFLSPSRRPTGPKPRARLSRRDASAKETANGSPAVHDNYHGALVKWRNHSVASAGTTFGWIRYHPGGYCGPRIQRDYQLVVLHGGQCQVEVDGARHDLVPGQVTLLRPKGREHFVFSKSVETSHSWCSVRPDCLPAKLRRQLDTCPVKAGLSLLLETLLRSTVEYASADSSMGAEVIDRLGVAVLTEYLHACEIGRRVPYDEPVVKALRHMDEHFGEVDCLRAACRAAACSRTVLIRKFRRSLGQTPGRHLWQLRTEKGIGLLRNTGLTVAEIAEQCGFSNPYHFSRRIRATTGLAPRALRAKAWGKAEV